MGCRLCIGKVFLVYAFLGSLQIFILLENA